MNLSFFQTKNILYRKSKILHVFIFLVIFNTLLTTELRADHNKFYALPRIGSLSIGSENIDNIQVAGILLGLRLANALYVETEINTSISGGDYSTNNNVGQLKIFNFSINGAYRQVWSKRIYAKLKVGIAYKSLEYDVLNNDNLDKKSDSRSASAGFGLGIIYYVATKPAMIEIEYTAIDKEVNLFTIGTTIPF